MPEGTKEPAASPQGDKTVAQGAESSNYRLRKADGGEVYGPIEGKTLKEWADSAQVAPGDEYDQGEGNWQPVTRLEFLDMIYKVKLSDGTDYGPTTVGTLREFLGEGIVTEETKVTNVRKNTQMPLAALLAAIDFKPRDRDPGEEPKLDDGIEDLDDLSSLPAVEMAKDQRIRQLEEDLKIIRKKHEELLQKYRKLNQELVEMRSNKS